MTIVRRLGTGLCILVLAGGARAVTIPGGGNDKKADCHVELMTNGVGFPAGGALKGSTCADGDVCDADGARNGSCLFTPVVCLNVADPALPKCSVAQISSVTFKGKIGKSKIDTSGFDAAVAALGLPVSASLCTAPVNFAVPVGGPDKNGELVRGTAQLDSKAKTTKGTDKDVFKFVCLPSVGPQTMPSTSTTVTTSTTVPGQTTSSTTIPPPAGTPGAGLQASITGAAVDANGVVTVTFRLTDGAGVAVVPRTASTSNPNEARVRFTIARLEPDAQSAEGVTTNFTKYVNYIVGSPAGGNQPTFDSNGTIALVDGATGTWTYRFTTTLPAGFPSNLTHTIGAQIERAFGGADLVANPVFDFVPNGSPVTTVREDTTTAQCNACHDPLEAHGGGRREVKLCVLCHVEGAFDPDTGNTIDFKQMVHRLHMGKDLPSVTDGPVGTKYSIIGFQGAETVFGEKVEACVNGPFPSAPCTADADCGAGGTCSGTTTVGVGFPQDVRNCTKCHGAGATAANHRMLPSTLACTGCHDDVNPGQSPINGLAPGTGHVPGGQPEAFCRVCHLSDQIACSSDADCTAGNGSCAGGKCEFDLTVPGAHTVPNRSAKLAGLQAEIVAASGTPSNPVQVQFRLKDGAGNPITSFTSFNRIGFAISGPTTDYGGSSTPLLSPTAFGGGATGTLTPPDGTGLATYTTATNLPADAVGTWTVGIEARRGVTVNGTTVNEAPQNVVKNFAVDGSAVTPRRTVVDVQNCASCHGTFSVDFSIHGNLRNRPEYCVICHNANNNDFARRKSAVASGADPTNESIAFKHLIHKIHRGEALEHQPYIVFGFGPAPANYAPNDFGEVRFPGDLRDCGKCHTGDSQLLPLPAGLLPTRVSVVNAGAEQITGATPPIQDACLACHDADDAAAHAETNTTASGAEACGVCHGEDAIEAVSAVHALAP